MVPSISSLTYIDGGRTPSGFYAVEEKEYITRFYRVSGSVKVELTALPQDWRYLDSRNVYILDSGTCVNTDLDGSDQLLSYHLGDSLETFPVCTHKTSHIPMKVVQYTTQPYLSIL